MKKIITLLLLLPIGMFSQTEDGETVINSVKKEVKKSPIPVSTDAKTVEKQEQNIVREPVCISGNCENGQGTMNYTSGTYSGTWKDNLRHGTGSYKWTNGDIYKGMWENDKRHGQGQYTWSDGSKYSGNYSHGIRSGYGIYCYTNGSMYEGTWQNNLKHGIANFYYKESVNIGGRYVNNEYVGGTGINQESYKYKPQQ